MNISLTLLGLVALIFLSGFFSGSETGMMSLNRYRLRHLVRKGSVMAKHIADLLERPDRLLGIILIGNTFANILASSLATVVAVHYFGDIGVLYATIILTLVVLIFAEATPKILAALHPLRFAFFAVLPLQLLLKVLYPLVFVINLVSNGVLRLFRIRVTSHKFEPISPEELRSIVHEASGKISATYQKMLLRILDLEHVTVEDVMVPRTEICGIDLQSDWQQIEEQLRDSEHAFLPIYRESIDRVQGILNLRKVLGELQQGELSKTKLQKLADKVYFVPTNAQLSKQLVNFQDQRKKVALVVDEYGDIEGLVTLPDILEEIVGQFTSHFPTVAQVKVQSDGSYLVDAMINVRDLNRMTLWSFPIEGPKTLSGLIIEHIEMMPRAGLCARVAGYPVEVLEVVDNRVKQVRVWPNLYREPPVVADDVP